MSDLQPGNERTSPTLVPRKAGPKDPLDVPVEHVVGQEPFDVFWGKCLVCDAELRRVDHEVVVCPNAPHLPKKKKRKGPSDER